MSKSIFNSDNTTWQHGNYQLFLGQPMALLDSVNVTYPKLFDLYKLQKSMDWSEDEVNLEQSRLDLMSASKNSYDIMVKTLAFQWELDSVASRAIAPLFAPFVTNSELWLMLTKQTEIENLHALTYSEIIRQCLPNPTDVFNEVMKNDEVLERSNKVVKVFNELAHVSGKYQAGMIDMRNPTEIRGIKRTIAKAVVALYCLEKIEFMASFACTFALAEQNIFQGIAKLVQKIAQDEQVHAQMDETIIDILLQDENSDWSEIFSELHDDIMHIIDSVVNQEVTWNKYLFSEGRAIVGLNETLLTEWVVFNAQPVYDKFGIKSAYPKVTSNPLPWMMNWLDLNKTQNANQEADNTNYRLNSVTDDSEDEIFDI